MAITIVGLGPGDPRKVTQEAWHYLVNADEIYARTREHPALQALAKGNRVHTFDGIYEQARTFQEACETLADRLVARAQEGQEVVYAVPGHPRVDEATTPLIEGRAHARGIAVKTVGGVSLLDEVCNIVGLNPLDGVTAYDAELLAPEYFPRLNTDQTLVLGQLHSRKLASDVKITLLNAYPPTHTVRLVHLWNAPQERVETFPLSSLDRDARFDLMTTLVVPPWPHPSSYESFQNVVHHLRSPDGCPWDRQQTHESLRRYLLEEAYEVLDALKRGDSKALEEELGDLLLQVGLHVAIASEEGEFLLGDVVGHVVDKLIRRHPHVFGDVRVSGAEEVIQNWEAIKRQEQKENGVTPNPFAGIPRTVPALMRASMIAGRAHWKPQASPPGSSQEAIELLSGEALGDLLFWLAGWAQVQGWNAELLLQEAIERFLAQQQCPPVSNSAKE